MQVKVTTQKDNFKNFGSQTGVEEMKEIMVRFIHFGELTKETLNQIYLEIGCFITWGKEEIEDESKKMLEDNSKGTLYGEMISKDSVIFYISLCIFFIGI